MDGGAGAGPAGDAVSGRRPGTGSNGDGAGGAAGSCRGSLMVGMVRHGTRSATGARRLRAGAPPWSTRPLPTGPFAGEAATVPVSQEATVTTRPAPPAQPDAPRAHLRPGAAADADELAQVYADAWRSVFGHLLPASGPELLALGRASVNAPWCLVAEPAPGGPVLGFVTGDPATGLLDRLCIQPGVTRSELGGLLLATAGTSLAGCEAVPRSWVWHADSRALSLYTDQGWVRSGRERPRWAGGLLFVDVEMLLLRP